MIPPIYCITLRQSPERTRLAMEHFRERGLDVTPFVGVHAPTMGLVTTKIADRRDNYVMASGQVGCLLSHYTLWQALQTFTDHPVVIIIEDDALFCDTFTEDMVKVMRYLPDDWQWCYLGHTTEDTLPARAVRVESTKYEPGTHAYMVKREALEVLLSTNQECRTHCDIQVSQNSLPHLRAYRVMPSLVEQRTQCKGDDRWLTTTNCLANTDATIQGPVSVADKRLEDLLWRIRSKLLPNLGGWCHEVKAVRMAELVVHRKPKVCVEIGVFQGKSLFTVAMALRFVGSGHVWGLDPWTQQDSLQGTAPGPNYDWWRDSVDHEHFYRSTVTYREQFGLSDWCTLLRTRGDDPRSVDTFEDGTVELFHLDGNHGPQSLGDVRAWLPKLAPKCVVFFDDDGWCDGGVFTTRPARELLEASGFEVTERCPSDCVVLERK